MAALALVADRPVGAPNPLPGASSMARPGSAAGGQPLGIGESVSGSVEMPWVVDQAAIGQRRQHGDADIDADLAAGGNHARRVA